MKKSIFKLGTIFIISILVSCGLALVYRVGVEQLINFITLGLTFTALYSICADFVEKIYDYPELLSWQYFGGVAIELGATSMFWWASLDTSWLWCSIKLVACIALCVGIYFYDKYVFNIVILNAKKRRTELETMRYKKFLAKAPTLTGDAIKANLKKWCRFMLEGDSLEAGLDFARPFDVEDYLTFNEIAKNGESELVTALDAYISSVVDKYIENRKEKN